LTVEVHSSNGGCTQSVVMISAASFTHGGRPGPTMGVPARFLGGEFRLA
jgi:hypothetical protein